MPAHPADRLEVANRPAGEVRVKRHVHGERSNLQGVALSERSTWGRAVENSDQIVERFGRLAEAGVQHVIISTADAHDPAALELLGRNVLPQLRGIEAADPRGALSLGRQGAG